MSKENKTTATTAVDQELIRQLAALLKETDLTEIEFERDDMRVRVARHAGVQPVSFGAASAPPAELPSAKPGSDPTAAREPVRHPGTVPSPMVGTAYYSPAPGSKPYVTIGDTVKAGQTVMIVEAMKTMNQIPAPRSGKVTEILVDDGQPVEYGEPLLIIE